MSPLARCCVSFMSLLGACTAQETPVTGVDGDAATHADDAATPGGDASTPSLDATVGDGDGDGDGDASTPAEPPFVLKVLSLNSWNTAPEVVAADIVAAGADVVGLQETTPAEAASICAVLGADWSFVQEDRANTFALLSRLPVLRRIGVTDATRGGIGATIEPRPGLRIHLFNTHLNWTPYGPYQLVQGMSADDVVASENEARMPALRELLDLAAPYVTSDDATFLIGDFNAPSHLDYAPAVPWPTSVAPTEAGFVDSYAELHPERTPKWAGEFLQDDPGITWTTHLSEEPFGCFDRIDFVYYSDGDATARESGELDAACSDHRAVLTTFALSGPARGERARNPLPLPGDAKAARHPVLTWTPARGASEERVHLGTASPDTLVATVDGGRFAPALLAAGTTYRWRVDSVTAAGVIEGEEWTFTTASSGGAELERHTYAPGETLSVRFDGGDARHDWIGLYPRRDAYGSGSPAPAWKYLGDSTSAPGSAIAEGSIGLVAPDQPGDYVLRFFDDDGYTVEDEVALVVE
jgi:endonuclease/exonuclease/phosphatase family metal-dependent hydrolase